MVELHLYKPEQVRAHLAEAAAIVDELGIAGDLRQPAFVKAVDMLSRKEIRLDAPAATPLVATPVLPFPPGRG